MTLKSDRLKSDKKGKFPNRILLVEGSDDFHVVCAICEKFHIHETFGIEELNGVEAVIADIPVRLGTLQFQNESVVIGVIVDADASLPSRWQALQDVFLKRGHALPEQPDPNGTIIDSHDGVRIGVWLMPNNQTSGMLEDFIRFLIPSEDKLLPIVDESLKTLKAKDVQLFKDIHVAKARVHTWLAWQEDPGTPLGLAITKTYLDPSRPEGQAFVQWLKNLFEVN
jgi:hypothetical protein